MVFFFKKKSGTETLYLADIVFPKQQNLVVSGKYHSTGKKPTRNPHYCTSQADVIRSTTFFPSSTATQLYNSSTRIATRQNCQAEVPLLLIQLTHINSVPCILLYPTSFPDFEAGLMHAYKLIIKTKCLPRAQYVLCSLQKYKWGPHDQPQRKAGLAKHLTLYR